MAQKHEDRLQTLDELFNHNLKVTKACTMGVIIDVTSPYLDEDKGHFIKRLKIIDPSFNMTKSINGLKFGYCTITIYAKRPDDLPNVRVLGDIIYLRRFAFQKYNDHFQGHSHKKDFCYWVLLDGAQDVEGFANYQSSRLNLNMEDLKFQTLVGPLQEARNFARKYLENNSIAKVVPTGLSPKDEDWIVKLILKGSQGKIRIMRGDEEFTIFDCPTTMTVGEYGKLRSVARVEEADGESIIVKNNFTSLLKIHEWMFDAQNAIKAFDKIHDENEEGLYTSLDTLVSTSPANCAGKSYWIKCEVFSISANTFSGAVKYYDAKKNQMYDTPHKGTSPIYKLNLLCQDSSLKSNKYVEVWIVSYDGKGGNFISQLNLGELNEFSSLVEEENLYRKRYDELLQAENVVIMVQCMVDGKGGKLFRAVEIK